VNDDPSGSERALILAPLGRDAQVAEAILREARLDGVICHDLPCLVAELDRGAGVALIVEESLLEQDYAGLARWIEDQPSWSDFPIVVLSRRGGGLERNPAAGRISQTLGNVTFLERPFHPTTLVSVIQTALRGRRRQYEARERIDAIRTAEAHFRTLAENIPILCWMARPDGHVFWFNPGWYEYAGGDIARHGGRSWAEAVEPSIRPLVEARWRHSVESGEPFDMTFPIRGADGTYRPFLTRGTPMRDEAGRIVRWFGTNTDVSRQLQDQERLRLMVNELNHRVKNTLATVQSIIALSLRGVDVPGPVRETLTNRVLALSKAHDVLTDEQWSGADLREIVQQAAEPYQTEGEARVRLDGPPVRLPPRTAIAIALALHELSTNAVKYGALSTAGGRVDLSWKVQPDLDGSAKLRLDWRESGGPPVQPPKRAGFGTRLIERGLSTDLQGRVAIEYRPDGVVCAIEAALPSEQGAPSLEDFLIPLTRSPRNVSPA